MKQHSAQPETDAQLQEAEHIAGLVIHLMYHAIDDYNKKNWNVGLAGKTICFF